MFSIDPAHEKMDMFDAQLSKDVWRDKYRWKDENHPHDSFDRIVRTIYQHETVPEYHLKGIAALQKGLWLPGGRITAGAGTEKRVTLMNCFVNETLEDSMEGIMRGNTNVAFTLQQSGGIGTDFSTLRPSGAILRRTHSQASGPLPFMRMFDSTSATILSAGDRRGAMMGTIADFHPDLPQFIVAKQQPGMLTQFNVSVLVSDAFMEAVREDEDWYLHFHIPPMERAPGLAELDFEDDNDVKQYVYSVWKARDLWDMILKNSYEWSEPGVIFIDRTNELNNLWYCEEIRCTNPCGEQPLPPHGTCNLGHVNLARMVRSPFTSHARFDWDLLSEIVHVGVRFLDNVIDVTKYPLAEQESEQLTKRRLGLGYTGLADALVQLNIRYGSPDAVAFTERVAENVAHSAYRASINLAKERGSFPLFDDSKFVDTGDNFANRLQQDIKEDIRRNGIRNALLLTVAPVGTGSVFYGDVGSGIEPFFDLHPFRKVYQRDGSWKEYHEPMYALKLYYQVNNLGVPPGSEDPGSAVWEGLPSSFVTADELTVQEHITMQAAAQRWVDASVSKTVNCPKEMTYEQYRAVYELAYQLGCKGCTTYRPSDVRGSILSKTSTLNTPSIALKPRPDALQGYTHKIKWPSLESALYMTVNFDADDNTPYEIFFASKDARTHDWMTSLSLMMTGIFRRGGDVSFVARELQSVQSLKDGAFIGERYRPSLPAFIGDILEGYISGGSHDGQTILPRQQLSAPGSRQQSDSGERCTRCHNATIRRQEGCKTCTTCGFSTCG
jgi:ribonucleoside-diphosphate reductase alpha chain